MTDKSYSNPAESALFDLMQQTSGLQEFTTGLHKLINLNPELINTKNSSGSTVLHLAVKNGNLPFTEILLNNGAAVNCADNSGETPLHWAVYTKNRAITELLLKHQADLHARDISLYTPAFFAVLTDNQEILELLYRAGDSFKERAFFDGSLLHYAAMSSSPQMIQYLIERGLPVNDRSINQETPLGWAMYRKNVQVIDILVDNGAKINQTFDIWGNCALTAAILSNCAECVMALIRRGAEINEKNSDGRTPLHTAVSPANERINLEMVKMLIDNGADVNAVKNDGVSVLMWAVKYGNDSIVRLLLENGAEVDPKTCRNERVKATVLHNAISGNKPEIIDLIITAARQLDLKDEFGKTPLCLAVETGNNSAVKQLIAQKASIFSVDDDGRTLLHHAAIHGYSDLAELLIESGVDLNRTDNKQPTALFYADKYGFKSLSDFLISLGAEKEFGTTDSFTADQPISANEARVWYLGHSGWAVKTAKNLLIFDYFARGRNPLEASLANGHIVAGELKNLKVTVFVSYLCPDHFDPQIFDLADQVTDCTFVYGFDPNKINPYSGPAYRQLGLNETETINGLEISTLLANVGGAGFLVSVDGITVFHPGDHAERTADHSGPYCGEIDFLAAKRKEIDIAFFPVQGDYLADPAIVREGIYYAIKKMNPKTVFPMHAGGQERVYRDFVTQSQPLFPCVDFVAVENRGDSFYYKKGE